MFDLDKTSSMAGYPGIDTGACETSRQQPDGGPQEARKYTFRDIGGRTRFLRALLGLGAFMAVIALVSFSMQLAMVSSAGFSAEEAQANDLRQSIIGLLQAPLFLFTVVVFACWIVRAQKNVRARGAKGLRIGPGWAVGYFFIPVLNLWRPYQAMQDLWRASHNPADWTGVVAGPILSAWWGLWVISSLVSHLTYRLASNVGGLNGLRAATCVQIVAGVLEVLLCLAAMRLVSQIAGAQMRHARSRETGGGGGMRAMMMPAEMEVEHAGVR